MKPNLQNSFEKRWQAAVRAPETVVVPAARREVDISIETIVDRYAMMLGVAVAEHSLDQGVQIEIAQQIDQLKSVVRKIDAKKIKQFKFKPPTL